MFDVEKQTLSVFYRYSAPEDERHLEPLHHQIEQIQHRYLYPWQLPELCLLADAHLEQVMADFGGELIRLDDSLRTYEWGIEAEHWIACLKKNC